MKRSVVLVLALLLASFIITACGETLSGMGKDAKRMGKGVKTIFVRDEE